ncbi:MAG: tRNA lysidine(34) synthetase TilS [Candidatus Omnitrophica bacterium]|nr:tRNA lysidine(34) synthetase TilS [Candidatus Omnitrophota bacterium]
MIEHTFQKTIEKYNLLEKKDKLILGVSGGPDSIFMLHMFCRLTTNKLQLVCAHFNHSLREEADEEENFVRSVCKDLGIRFVSEKKDVKKLFKGDSLEQTARNLRLDFFLRLSRQFKIKKLAIAHHKDDVVETMLMRIIRGAALKGLRGILPKSSFKGLCIIRPLVEIRKGEILQWLAVNKISYRTDKTNFEDKFFRNKIRLKLLPVLEELNPNITNTIFNLSRLVTLDYEFISAATRDAYSRIKKEKGRHYVKISLEALKKQNTAMILNIIRLAIEELKGDTRRLDFRHFEEILDLIHARPAFSIVDLPDLEVKKDEGWLIIKSLLF